MRARVNVVVLSMYMYIRFFYIMGAITTTGWVSGQGDFSAYNNIAFRRCRRRRGRRTPRLKLNTKRAHNALRWGEPQCGKRPREPVMHRIYRNFVVKTVSCLARRVHSFHRIFVGLLPIAAITLK